MDAVRFGRALGFGARQAAKTVVRAVDAARSENPSQNASVNQAHNSVVTAKPISSAYNAATQTAAASPVVASPVSATARRATPARGVQEGLTRFKASALEPAVRLSSVLWLEVTGVFFAIFALAAANGVWRLRAELRPALAHPAAHGSLLGAALIFALFAYFSISSFVRAHRRQRRR
jgi:hypothetical protein